MSKPIVLPNPQFKILLYHHATTKALTEFFCFYQLLYHPIPVGQLLFAMKPTGVKNHVEIQCLLPWANDFDDTFTTDLGAKVCVLGENRCRRLRILGGSSSDGTRACSPHWSPNPHHETHGTCHY